MQGDFLSFLQEYKKATVFASINSDNLSERVGQSSCQGHDLVQLKRNSLLGLNLRYYVRKKEVDDQIDESIKKDRNNFWYKNNGIVIICDDYCLDGKEVKLWNFSIINGGQTTNRIGNVDFDGDFYLQCKIVKAEGDDENERSKFALSIAGATNSQKPIKKADLLANSLEQLKLKTRFKAVGVQYITKNGERVKKEYSLPYKNANLEHIGKIGLASIMQMPGTSRTSSKKMYQEDIYHQIFGLNVPAGVLADALRVEYLYDEFAKENKSNPDYERDALSMIKHGRTFQIACIAFLSKVMNGVIDYSKITANQNNIDELKKELQKIDGMIFIINSKIDDEKSVLFEIFDYIASDVLGYCYTNAREKAESQNSTLDPSDYLKNDSHYYKDVILRLWKEINRQKRFKKAVERLVIKVN